MIPQKLTDEIEKWMKNRKYGNLQINFVDGKIMNVNRTESIRVEAVSGGTVIHSTASSIDK